jgi:hypothetical protein
MSVFFQKDYCILKGQNLSGFHGCTWREIFCLRIPHVSAKSAEAGLDEFWSSDIKVDPGRFFCGIKMNIYFRT